MLQVVACCGYWDNSIRCYSVDEGSLLQSVRVHKDIVTCIEVGSDGRTLASGAPCHPSLQHILLQTSWCAAGSSVPAARRCFEADI